MCTLEGFFRSFFLWYFSGVLHNCLPMFLRIKVVDEKVKINKKTPRCYLNTTFILTLKYVHNVNSGLN